MPVWMTFRSVPQTPPPRTRTWTSSSPGTGTGRSCSSNRCGATRTVAFIVRGISMRAPFRSLTLQLDVFVRRRERVPGDDSDPRLLHSRSDAVQAGVQPDGGNHHLVVHELLDAVQGRLASL